MEMTVHNVKDIVLQKINILIKEVNG